MQEKHNGMEAAKWILNSIGTALDVDYGPYPIVCLVAYCHESKERAKDTFEMAFRACLRLSRNGDVLNISLFCEDGLLEWNTEARQ